MEDINNDSDESESAQGKLVPQKSKEIYEKQYENFCEWRRSKNDSSCDEKLVMLYFSQMSKIYKPSSLWCIYSKLKKMIQVKEGVDISTFLSVTKFMKNNSLGESNESKKSLVLQREHIQEFMLKAPDFTYLLVKVVAVFGMFGACRREELHDLRVQDVTIEGSVLLVKVGQTKSYTQRQFTIVPNGGPVDYVALYKKYVGLRPKHTKINSLFLCYHGGKCGSQPVGKNTFGKMPRRIAEFLKLPDANLFTGRCFRMSAATILRADSGRNTRTVKQLRQAESYVGNFLQINIKIEPGEESSSSVNTSNASGCGSASTISNVPFTFRGHMAPVFTPFNDDRNKSLNLEILPAYAKHLLANDIKGILVNGTSGEGMSMSVHERKLLAEEWVKICRKTKQTVMVQVGGAPLPDVLEMARHAEALKVDALLCLPELYMKPKNADQLINYLKIVSEAAPNTPLLYYHIPAFTNVNINMAEFLTKADGKIATLAGIKFTSCDLVEGTECVKVCKGKYAVFLGADQILCAAYALGFDSAIATTFNIFPRFGATIFESFKSKAIDLPAAQQAQRILTANVNSIIKYGDWVTTMKCAMNLKTPINVGPVREPLENLTEDKKIEMDIDCTY